MLLTNLSEENEPAYNKRTLLRNPFAEYSQSISSTHLNELIAPNRDYAYEGFSALSKGENWKYLDALLYGLKKKKAFLELTPESVEATPFKTIYNYSASEEKKRVGSLSAEYFLQRGKPRLEIIFRNTVPNSALVLKPLIDVRHAFASSTPIQHELTTDNKKILVKKDGKTLSIEFADAQKIFLQKKIQHWNYKLGDGARSRVEEKTIPKNEERLLLDAGLIELKPCSEARVIISAGRNRKKTSATHNADKELNVFSEELRKASELWDEEEKKALENRFLVLMNCFGVFAGNARLPDAGAFWYRNFWFRDAFEGILTNFQIYSKVRIKQIRQVILLALCMEKKGLIPNYLPVYSKKEPTYNTVDSTLLCYIAALEYTEIAQDEKMLAAVKTKVTKSIHEFEKKGGDVTLSKGLLETPANYSWSDAVANGFPTRLPKEWIREYGEKTKSEKYYLIELNALWLKLLQKLSKHAPELEELLDEAGKTFCKKFCGKKFPPHISHDEFRETREESSHALQAMALLPSVYSTPEVQRALKESEKKLFAYRNEKLFGVITRNSGEKLFEGDEQYHCKTVWLRETPYFLKLATRVGRKKEVEDVLLNVLWHQENESALFYSQELFGYSDEKELIPVKNPAQYWSQWVQPFFEFLNDSAPSTKS